MKMLCAGLALVAAGCGGTENKLTLAPVPASCTLSGSVDHLVVTALGDLGPSPSLSSVVSPQGKMVLGPFNAAVHVITVEAVNAAGARVGIGQTAPFNFGTLADGPLAIAYAGADAPCAIAALHTPRFGHRATLVDGGRVLITGGLGATGPATTIELYDPTTASFLVEGDLAADFAIGHTATLLADGTVLIAGGQRADLTGSTGSLRVASDGVLSAPTTGPLGAARAFHAAVLLAGGDVMITGGCARVDGDACAAGATLDGTEIFNLEHGTWRDGPRLLQPRSHHQAILRGDGKVLVINGRGDGGPVFTAELLDLDASHPAAASVPSGRAEILDSGAAVIAGGEVSASKEVVLVPSPSEGFISIGSLSVARGRPTMARFTDGDILISGGVGPDGHASGAVDLVTTLGTVRGLAAGPPRSDHTATPLLDGSMLVVGGRDQTGAPRGDGQLWIHSLLGPYANLGSQTFTDGASSQIVIRRPDHAKIAGGRLALFGSGPGEGGRPGELALLRAESAISLDVNVSVGRGAPGSGAAVIVGWLGDADYRFVQLVTGQPVQLFRVAPASPTGSTVTADPHCAGSMLTDGLLPIGDLAPVRISLSGGDLRVDVGGARLLECAPTDLIPRGLVGVGSLGGEALFDDLAVTRN